MSEANETAALKAALSSGRLALQTVLGSRSFRHKLEVNCVAFSPRGDIAATGGDDGVRTWDLATGRELASGGVERFDTVEALAFSPDGATILVGDDSGNVVLRDAATLAEVRRLGEADDGEVTSLSFSPDGKRALALSEGSECARCFEVASGKLEAELDDEEEGGALAAVVFSPDGKLIVGGGEGRVLHLWDAETWETKGRLACPGPVTAVALSGDGKLALSGHEEGAIVLWDLEKKTETRRLVEHESRVTSLAFSPDGRAAVSGSSDWTACLWDIASGKGRVLAEHALAVSSVAFSPDGKLVLTGGQDGSARLLDAATGEEKLPASGHRGPVACLAFSQDAKLLLTGSRDNAVALWDVPGARLVRTIPHEGEITAVALSPDGRTLFSACEDGAIRRFDAASGREERKLDGAAPGAVAFSRDARLALTEAGREKGELALWDLPGGEVVRTLPCDKGVFIECLALSKEASLALAGGYDHKVRLWDAASGAKLRTFSGHGRLVNAVAFSQDERFVLSASMDGTVKLWDPEKGWLAGLFGGQVVRTFAAKDDVSAIAVSPDGSSLFACSDDGHLRCFEIATGEVVCDIDLGGDDGLSLAVSGDGKLLAVGTKRSTILVFDVARAG